MLYSYQKLSHEGRVYADSAEGASAVMNRKAVGNEVRLSGRILLVARALWLACACFELILFMINLLQPLFGGQTLICPFSLTCPYDTDTATLHALGQAHIALGAYTIYVTTFGLIFALTFVGLSILLFWRAFDQVTGLLASFGFLLAGSIGLMGDFARLPLALQFVGAIQIQLLYLCFGFFLVTFPDGRFIPRWSWLIGFTLFVQGLLFQSGSIFSWPSLLILLELVLAYGSPVALQIYRYRRVYTPVQRQQTRWVVFGLLSAMVLLLLGIVVQGFIPPIGSVAALLILACDSSAPLAFLLIPFCITIAILRSQLWDIDALINRTLVYGSLTVMLALVYFGLVIGLQALLRGFISQDNSVAIVISTLTIAALFQPLRRGIQRIIDRRFYRRKYDATKTLEAFSATLRNEVDLNQVREHLITVVQETMQPAHVSLWLRPLEQQRTHQTPWRANTPDSTEGR